jgi:ATP-dependent RNA helicase DDX56/DBP9
MAMEPILLDKEIFWSSFGLDPRLERAIAKLGWNVPTLVQAKAIPLALQGLCANINKNLHPNEKII